MADTTIPIETPEDPIAKQYRLLTEAQTAKNDSDYKVSRDTYQNQLGKSEETYQPLRNEAYVNNALAEKSRKENMANMGMSGEGGTSMSLQQRNTGNLLSTLGDVSRQQRGFEDDINLALTNLDTTHNAANTSVTAELDAQRIGAQLAQSQFDQNLELSQSQYDLAQKNSIFDQYYALLKDKRITKDEFELATGIDLR